MKLRCMNCGSICERVPDGHYLCIDCRMDYFNWRYWNEKSN